MKLLTKENIKKLPKLYETEEQEIQDKMIYAKLFTPWTSWTWYVIEFDGVNQCFGFVKGDEGELGYFSLRELAKLEGPLGLKVERDKFFTPIRFGDLTEG